MMGITHLAVAGAMASGYLYFAGSESITYVTMLFFLVGALFPDIDSPKSLFGRPFRSAGFKLSHRGLAHTLIALLVFTTLSAIFGLVNALAFGLGYLLHLALDAATVYGIQIVPGKKVEGFIETGGAVDNGILIVSVMVTAAFVLLLI